MGNTTCLYFYRPEGLLRGNVPLGPCGLTMVRWADGVVPIDCALNAGSWCARGSIVRGMGAFGRRSFHPFEPAAILATMPGRFSNCCFLLGHADGESLQASKHPEAVLASSRDIVPLLWLLLFRSDSIDKYSRVSADGYPADRATAIEPVVNALWKYDRCVPALLRGLPPELHSCFSDFRQLVERLLTRYIQLDLINLTDSASRALILALRETCSSLAAGDPAPILHALASVAGPSRLAGAQYPQEAARRLLCGDRWEPDDSPIAAPASRASRPTGR
jgi:hypothetical protein